MRRVRLLLVATAICTLGPTQLWVSPASATPSLTVTPNTDLKFVSIVDVEGAGFPASARILICQGVINGTAGQDDCNPNDLVQTIGAEANGTFSLDIFVTLSIPIPSLGRTVDCTIDRCGVIAGVLDDFANTAVFVPITFLPGQPDGRIKRRSDGQIFGDNIFGDNVFIPSWTHTIAPGGYWTYALQVQNDGPTADDITVSAGRPGVLGEVQFFYGFSDVTSAVRGSGLTFPDMAPGEVRTFAMRFHVRADAAEGSRIDSAVFFTSDTNGSYDELPMQVVAHTPT